MEIGIILLAILLLGAVYLLWLRPWQLHWGATAEELARSMPGDEVVAAPSFNATRAVTVEAPAQAIYPWIIQMGVTPRAGWYSYDLLDNLGRPSAESLMPELQQIFPGQLIPMSPDGKNGLYVKAYEKDRWILWGDLAGDTTWAWGFYPDGKGRTRLITRVRSKYRWGFPQAFFNLLLEFCDMIMMRKCMLDIKARAEKLVRGDRKAV
ncbi:MAG TPA: hypothetical protein PKW33_06305 [Anaerolineaceae bacterium]|nr:hypothetical protein [Anaerolineaceae bacterium]HPN51179.1 hypothetical protein [Anaerolineaceae bacterium]